MIPDDEARPAKAASHVVGQDLSALSIADIDVRIEALGAEIRRLEEMRKQKVASQAAASALFKL